MTARVHRLRRIALDVLVVAVILALVAGVALKLWPRHHEDHLTVDFTRTVALYPGSSVRILGVNVGTVDSVEPRGTTVRVTLSWDARYPVPNDVHAVIVSPAIVGDRFIQLTPAYTGGPTLPDDSYLDQSRTSVPVELDQTYAALNRLATALGPNGANKNGALSQLVVNGARNLRGQGAKLNRSINALAKLGGTFAENKDAFFDSITKLSTFVGMLDTNDAAVRHFNTSLANVSAVLAGERTDLSNALASLASSLGDVQRYVTQNRSSLRKNIHGLTSLTKTLVDQKKNLAAILTRGPNAITDLLAAYNPTTGTMDTRGILKAKDSNTFSLLTNPFVVSAYCGLAAQQNPNDATTCYDVGKVVQQLAAAVPKTSGTTSPTTSAPSASSKNPTSADPGGLGALLGVTP